MKRQPILVDIGNSTTVIASVTGEILLKCDTSQLRDQFPIHLMEGASKILVSSVVPSVDALFSAYPHTQFITYQNIPLINTKNLPNPAQVGADRLVNAVGAYHKYATDCLIIDSGTAITFCYVDKDGRYEGGAIVPGMGIASKALNDYTAKIPLIWVSPTDHLYGKTTEEAVRAGLYHGYIHLINGMITSYRTEFPSITVVGTGTGLDYLLPHLQLDHYEPNLILEGLGVILTLTP
jgi:type III pantothenate kinase